MEIVASDQIKSRRRDRTAGNEITRKQLIEATIESIAIHGFNKTTLSSVTRLAKMSHGIVNFHFQSKDLLLLEALKYLVDEHLNHWRVGLANAKESPEERLLALISTDFDPRIAHPKRLAVWFAYWGEVNNRPAYREIAGSKDIERRQQIKLLCNTLKRSGNYNQIDTDAFVTNLEALIDGLWLRLLLSPNNINTAEAKLCCQEFLAATFPQHFP